MLHKSFPATLLPGTPDDPPGTMEAIVAVLNNVDRGRERIKAGFFAESLTRKLPKGVWGHDWLQPVAKTTEARELLPGDPLLPPALSALGGYYIKAQFNLDTQRGHDAYSDVKFGIVDEFSIGYDLTEQEYQKAEDVTDLIKGEWFEWSPVLVGMNSATALLSVKGAALRKPGGIAAAVKQMAMPDWEAMDVLGTLLCYVRDGQMLATADAATLLTVEDQLRAALAVATALLQAQTPASKRAPAARVPFDVQAARTVSAVAALVKRAESRARLRQKEGRQISAANMTRLMDIPAALRDAGAACVAQADKLDAFLTDTAPPAKAAPVADLPDWGLIQLTTQRLLTQAHTRV